MRDIRKELIEMLIAEVKPAVGCTEPVAVALACAKAKELLGEEIEENRILVSPSIYKNGMCVGIPGTDRLGLKIAVAMGFVGGHSENGLTVLETLSQDEVEESERYMDTQPINVVPAQTKDKVFIEVDLRGKNNIAKVVIKEKHDNFVYLQKNQEVLLDTGDYNNNEEIKVADENVVERKATFMDTTNVEEIIKNVENNIENTFSEQINNVEKLDKYINNWKEDYKNQDFNSMKKEYKKMEKVVESLIPIENIINEFNTIKNFQNLISANGNNFNLTQDELELAQKLF